MKVLCVSPGLPCQLDPIAKAMAAKPQHKVRMASLQRRVDVCVPGVGRILIRKSPAPANGQENPWAQAWLHALRLRANALSSFHTLRDSGFVPDMALFQAGSGISLHLRDVFPAAIFVAYADPAISTAGDPAASIQNLQFAEAARFFVRMEEQKNSIAPALRPLARYLPIFVDTDLYRPGAESRARQALLFSIGIAGAQLPDLWRLAIALGRVDCQAEIICGTRREEQLLCQWREHLEGAAQAAPRIHYRLADEAFISLAQASSLAVFSHPTPRNFHILLQVMSCGCPVMAGGGLSFLKTGDNCLAWPQGSVDAQLREMEKALANKPLLAQIGKAGRESVIAGHCQKNILPSHIQELEDMFR